MASGSFNRAPAGSRIAIVGAGALGNAVLPHLTDPSLRGLTIIDGDRIDRKNLERQPLFTVADVDRFKASTLVEQLRAGHDGLRMIAHDVFLDANNAHSLLRDHDIVIEGVDDLHAKALIERVCADLRIPVVSGGVHGDQGQVLVLHAPGANTELGRGQMFPGRQGDDQDGCDMRNIPIELLEAMGMRMATLALDVLRGVPAINGRIEILDARSDRRMIIELAP